MYHEQPVTHRDKDRHAHMFHIDSGDGRNKNAITSHHFLLSILKIKVGVDVFFLFDLYFNIVFIVIMYDDDNDDDSDDDCDDAIGSY